MEPHQRRIMRVSRIKFVVVVVLILIALFVWYADRGFYVQTMSEEVVPLFVPGMMDSGVSKSYPDYYREQPSITDTREFLKINFSATIQTRDVPKVVTDVKNIIAGADGRIDELYSSEKSGRISFVVARSKFEAFHNEVEALTHKKLYTENISSQNLLGQKQSIEERTSAIASFLDDLNKQKNALTATHTQAVNGIQSELTRIQGELTAVRTQIGNTTNQQVLTSLRSQEATLVSEDATQRQRLTTENNTHASRKQKLDNLITNYNNSLAYVNEEDQQFTDNIETVNGSIYVRWVSLWKLADIFSPVSPVILIIVLVILIWFYLRHLGYIPRVEWV